MSDPVRVEAAPVGNRWKRRRVEAARQKKGPGKRPPGDGRIAKTVPCPYCGEGTRHEVPTTRDERRPVVCPYCGKKFDLRVHLGGLAGADARPPGRRGAGRPIPPRPEVTPANVLATLVRLDADRQKGIFPILEYGVCLEPPAPRAAVRRMQEAAVRDLGVPVPDSFAALLLLSNGASFNGAVFKTAERLVFENLAEPRPGVVVLGRWHRHADRIYEFVFDPRDGRFHTISEGNPDGRLESFETFESLLVAVVEGREFPGPSDG